MLFKSYFLHQIPYAKHTITIFGFLQKMLWQKINHQT